MSINPIILEMNRKNFSKNMLASMLIFTSIGVLRASPPTNDDLENQKSKLKYLEKTYYYALRFPVAGFLYYLGGYMAMNALLDAQISISKICSEQLTSFVTIGET